MAVQNNLIPPSAPALPLARPEYDRASQDQNNSILRLFFTHLVSTIGVVVGEAGGQYVDCPNGLFYSTSTQTLAAANTGYPIAFEHTHIGHFVVLGDTSRLLCTVGGVYNFQFTAQAVSSNTSANDIYFWLRRDGVDVGFSAHAYTISGSDTKSVLNFSFDIDVQAGQYLEIIWSATSTTVSLASYAPAAPHPGISSAVAAVNFVAPLSLPLPFPS
jgi:hypothetical protein